MDSRCKGVVLQAVGMGDGVDVWSYVVDCLGRRSV